jgi:anti-sigma factor RsiW
MKIDRHNYEEFFLLYVDNELNPDQKKQVEKFVQENAHLQEEFVMLQQSKLITDDSIVFGRKDLLMKDEESSFINMSNYEEWLVLYTDNELNEDERATVEKFSNAHTHVKAELDLFIQTKLQSEEIRFPEKKSLYRTKEKIRSISLVWRRVAVAAILIIAAGVITFFVLNRNSSSATTKGGIAKTKNESESNHSANTVKEENKQTVQDNSSSVKQQPEIAKVSVQSNEKQTQINQEKQNNLQKKQQNILPVTADNSTSTKTDIQSQRPGIINNLAFVNTNEPQIKNDVAINEKIQSSQLIKKDDVTSPTFASLNSSDTKSENSLATDDGSNKKLRGFFRKATRLFAHTTKINPANDDNKLLLGGVAINLK